MANFKVSDNQLNWRGLRDFLGDRDSKIIAHNTKIIPTDYGSYTMTLHDNHIARFERDGTILVSLAGWATVTTKERLNHIPNVNVWTKDFTTYCNGEVMPSNAVIVITDNSSVYDNHSLDDFNLRLIDPKFWVRTKDKFMSGWGLSEGKNNILIFACQSRNEVETVMKNCEDREDFIHTGFNTENIWSTNSKLFVQNKTTDYKNFYTPNYFKNRR